MICNASMQRSTFHLFISLEYLQNDKGTVCLTAAMETDKHEKGCRTILNQLTLSIFSTVFFVWALSVFIYISGVCCVAMVTSVLHPHCVCSLIKSVLNHVFTITMYVPSHKVCYALLPWWNVCSSDSRCHAWRVNNPGNEIIPSRYAYLGWGLWGEPNQAAHWHQVCHSCQLQLGCSCQPLLAFSFPSPPPFTSAPYPFT